MNKWKLLTFSVCSLIALSLLTAKEAKAIDNAYLKGRAIQLADFGNDELVVEPKLVYSWVAGDRGDTDLLSSPNNKIINLISPKFSPAGITAVFEKPKYTIIDQSKTHEIFSFKRRVGDILSYGGVELAKEDIVAPPVDALEPLADNLIKITRVSLAEIENFEPVPYQQKKIDDPNLNKGIEKVTKPGKNGRKRLLYQVRRENGVETSRKLLSSEIIDQPTDQVLSIGIKPVITVKCKYDDTVIAASQKYNIDPNQLCSLMIKESNGNSGSINPDGYYGLFQYNLGFWDSASKKAGYAGALWSDPTAQIYTTAWAFANGYRGRWP